MRSFRIRLVLFFFLPLFLGVGRGRRGGETSLSCWTAISAFTFFRLCTLFWIRFGYAFVGGEEDTRLAMEMDMARVWYLSLRCERRAVGSVRGEDSSGAGFSSSLREHVSACASGTLAPNSLGNRKAEQSAEHRTKEMTVASFHPPLFSIPPNLLQRLQPLRPFHQELSSLQIVRPATGPNPLKPKQEDALDRRHDLLRLHIPSLLPVEGPADEMGVESSSVQEASSVVAECAQGGRRDAVESGSIRTVAVEVSKGGLGVAEDVEQRRSRTDGRTHEKLRSWSMSRCRERRCSCRKRLAAKIKVQRAWSNPRRRTNLGLRKVVGGVLRNGSATATNSSRQRAYLVESHRTDPDHGRQLLGDPLGAVEEVEIKLELLLLRDELDSEPASNHQQRSAPEQEIARTRTWGRPPPRWRPQGGGVESRDLACGKVQ